MRRFIAAVYTDLYKKLGYPHTRVLFSDCSYNNAASAIERFFEPKKVDTKSLNVNIILIKTDKATFIYDEAYQNKKETGLLSIIEN